MYLKYLEFYCFSGILKCSSCYPFNVFIIFSYIDHFDQDSNICNDATFINKERSRLLVDDNIMFEHSLLIRFQ